MKLKKMISEQLSREKDPALENMEKQKLLLDYTSFGIATESEKEDLKMISGIGSFIEEKLNALNIFTYRQISRFTPQDIETINKSIEFFSGRIERDEWVAQAKEIVFNKDKWTELLDKITEKKELIYYNRIGKAKKEEEDDLTRISGVGGWIKEKLNALEIFTFKQIGNFTQDDIQAVTLAIEYFPDRIERDEWILQAKELIEIEGKKSELFKRIIEKNGSIIFERLGIALKHHANNLTLINGIGLWMEERLNLIKIYTFKQIGNITSPDIATIAEILEISPERIDIDNWVAQARKLIKTI